MPSEGDPEPSSANDNDGSVSIAPSVSETAAETRPAAGAHTPLLIVGIGASAGGLEALQALLSELEPDSMAFVVVTHLARDADSVLPELLARSTRLPVAHAEDGMRVTANHIYVLAPGTTLRISGGVLRVEPQRTDRARLPIDVFFRSLAEDQGSSALGVILSGSGSDGSFGLRAIKDAGGFTFAQDPKTAQYGSMPESALRAGADNSLSPAAIGQELMRIGGDHYATRASRASAERPAGIAQLLVLVRSAFNHDLTHYKPSTIDRRIARRMALKRIDSVDQYVELVRSNADELRTLYSDMLINVTSFFRDHEPFEALKDKIIPGLVQSKRGKGSIRAWVPACSTGEEPYSIAMSIVEALGDSTRDYRIQIFATDVDDESVQSARRGIFAEHIALDVTPERLLRFFVKRDGDYQINRRIRDMVVFSTHNVTKDAPFSRVDLVSCRNLLIYLQPVMQKKVLRLLHYALNPHGYLILGNSETVGDSPELFTLLDRKNRIYLPKHLTPRSSVDLMSVPPSNDQPTRRPPLPRPLAGVAALADRKILELYGPPGVVINESLDILHFRGRTGAFLEPAPGEASLNVLRLARPELHADLRRAIHQATADNAAASALCTITEDGKPRTFRLEVIPMIEPETRARCLLVVFNDPPPPSVASDQRAEVEFTSPAEQRIAELDRELAVTKEYLQSTVEELESSNEELKSSNEELQSSNEELQSTNEEVETSREEMQSTNEELTSVNDELQMRMAELQIAYDDLHNVMTGADSAVVITGMDVRIRRYTQAAEKVLGLLAEDIGSSVNRLNAFFGGIHLEQAVIDVVQTLTPYHRETLCSDGRWRAVSISPYKTLDHVIRGAVLVASDIDVRHRALQLAHSVASYAQKSLAHFTDPLVVIDGQTRIVWTNDHYLAAFQVTAEETIGNLLNNLGRGHWRDPALEKLVDATLATGASFQVRVVRADSPDVGATAYAVSGVRLSLNGSLSDVVLLSFAEHGEPSSAP